MTALSWVFSVNLVATVLIWCFPMLLFPSGWLLTLGLTPQPNDFMFVRLLGWAYLALCVGYGFGLRHALNGRRALCVLILGSCRVCRVCACVRSPAACVDCRARGAVRSCF